ncbi:hypothetical protein KCU77_g5499, partial [Aureobasidium melanogenum]
MNPSNNPLANDIDSDSESSSSNASIPRYGGYKHSSPCYEDFEMWNSVCEDAEPGWEYKEAQRLAKKRQQETRREVARKQKEEKEEVNEKLEREEKEETAEMRRSQTPPVAPAITRLGSPFDYQRSKHAAQPCTQDLARITHNNHGAAESDSVLDAENDGFEIEHDTKSCQGLSLEEVLGISRPDNVKKQPRPASGARTCALM